MGIPTPGPWIADENEDGRGFTTIRRADGTPTGDIEAPEIATVYAAIDADLIAAAPELLAALKTALPYAQKVAATAPTEPARIERQRKAVKAVSAICAAIAHAEGGQ